jgi:hypothetical protein
MGITKGTFIEVVQNTADISNRVGKGYMVGEIKMAEFT